MKKQTVTCFTLSKLLRSALAVLLLVSLPLLVSGCHKAKKLAEYVLPETFDASKHYDITFWAKNDTNNVQRRIYEQAIKDFEAAYPNVTVTMRQYTDYGAIYNDVITNISTGTTPNVCISYPDHIATYLSGENIVVSLDAFFASDKYGFGGTDIKYTPVEKNGVVQKFLDEGRFDNHYYALPFMRSTEACYINKDMVEKLGYTIPEELTWEFVFEVSEAALEKDENGVYKVNGQKVLIPFIYKSTDNMMIQMLKQKNAGYSDEAGNVYIFNDTTKELLNEIAKHAESRAFSTFAISSYPGNYLNAGQCIFAIDSTAGATWLGEGAPLSDIHESAKVSFETVVKPIPQFDPSNPQMISQGPSLCIFNKEDTGEVLASWLFAQYLLTDKVQAAYSQTEGYVPVTKSARESEQYKDYLSRSGEDNDAHYKVKIDATKMLLENTENTFITPVFNGSASLRNAAGQLIEDVANAVRRKQTVDDAFYAQEKERIMSLYRLDNLAITIDGHKNLGKLPGASLALIITLIVVWVGIAAYFIYDKVRTKQAAKKNH